MEPMNNQHRVAILNDMGIPQWVSRGSASAAVFEQESSDDLCITVSGQASGGWIWLLELSLNEKDQSLLADIRRATGCLDSSLIATLDAQTNIGLKQVLKDELITCMVLIGSEQFRQQVSGCLSGVNIACINCPPLTELQGSASSKRKLWGKLKAQMD